MPFWRPRTMVTGKSAMPRKPATPGVRIYLSAADVEALHHAHGQLYTQLEAAQVDVPELILAHEGIYRLIEKAAKAAPKPRRSTLMAKALSFIEDDD